MPVLEFSCRDCGPFTVMAVDEVRSRPSTIPVRCPLCAGPVSVDVVEDSMPRGATTTFVLSAELSRT